MANQEHLELLKQGVDVWNQWRKEHSDVRPDINGTNFSNIKLSGTNFRIAYLQDTTLKNTDLHDADLIGANLSGADLSNASLSGVRLIGADLSSANLTEADLSFAEFSGTDLSYANLSSTTTIWTIFANVDLRTVIGLDTIQHKGPSTIGIDTIMRSEGAIPERFLREAGVTDNIITYTRSLVNHPIDFYSCFISYSSKNQEFAERLYADLQAKGVRCWYAPENMKTGDVIRSRIDEAIRIHDKLLLVLSQHSVESSWVEKEVETAFEKEHQQKRHVLFPVRLDDVVMQTSTSWAADIRRMRHITDFTDWKDHDSYQKAFSRLLRDLKAET